MAQASAIPRVRARAKTNPRLCDQAQQELAEAVAHGLVADMWSQDKGRQEAAEAAAAATVEARAQQEAGDAVKSQLQADMKMQDRTGQGCAALPVKPYPPVAAAIPGPHALTSLTDRTAATACGLQEVLKGRQEGMSRPSAKLQVERGCRCRSKSASSKGEAHFL